MGSIWPLSSNLLSTNASAVRAGKLIKFRIKLLAGDKVLVEISPYELTRGRITYRERNAGAPGGRPGGNRPGGPRRR